MPDLQTGAVLIAAERQRQIHVEGYTPEHDAVHGAHDLMLAAIAYMSPNDGAAIWPWEDESFKPEVTSHELGARRAPYHERHGSVRDLAKAGALIAAAIDVLLAQEATR